MGHMKWEMPCFTDEINNAFSNSEFAPLLAAVLQARGADTPEKAKRYLMRDETMLSDPMLLEDMDKAVSRVELALEKHQKVAVFGDYDVDGITSSCLLMDYFKKRGLECEVYIPDRLGEGYGVNKKAIEILHDNGASLIITVDCGITAVAEIAYANSLGMDIIITDHHECPRDLPEAAAIIDPKRPNSAYPFDALAGVGVVFKLVCALEKDSKEALKRYADLLAVGTIADVMPLTGENRFLVYRGLEKLKNNPRPGFAALLEEAGAGQKPLTSMTVGFTLAPRINAAGRLCSVETSVRLLLSEDKDETAQCAKELCSLNLRRQKLETEVWEDAMASLTVSSPKSPIVLESCNWHPGVVGIAASRLTEEYRLPTIMICVDDECGKGSCRSYGDFNLFAALTACSEYLESFGGHAFAAGLNIKPEKIDAFRRALADYYILNPPTEHPDIRPEILINNPAVLNMEGVEALDELEPCGSDNEKPLMCIYDAILESATPIGNGKHLRIRIMKNGVGFDCVFFSHTMEGLGVLRDARVDICFTPQINDFRAHRSVQLLIADIRPSETLTQCRDILEREKICAEEFRVFRPKREELAFVWKKLQSAGGHMEFEYNELAADYFERIITPVKLCLCIKIFNELKLLEVNVRNGGIGCSVCDNGMKTDLDKSPLFRLLWDIGRRETVKEQVSTEK